MKENDAQKPLKRSIGIQFPLTLKGFIITVVCSLYLFCRHGFWVYNLRDETSAYLNFDVFIAPLDHVLAITAIFSIALVCFCAVFVYIGYYSLNGNTSTANSPVLLNLEISDDWNPTGFSIPILRYIPCICVSAEWVAPGFGQENVTYEHVGDKHTDYRGKEKIKPNHRCYFHRIHRKIIFHDFFGLSRMRSEIVATNNVSIMILPGGRSPKSPLNDICSLTGGEEAVSDGQTEGDRMDTRQYRHGDPARHIHWKAVAKTGGQKHYVRIPEKVGEKRVALFLWAGEGDQYNAQLARSIIEKDLLGTGWVFGTSTSPDSASWTEKEKSLKLLAASGNFTNRFDVKNQHLQNFKKFQKIAEKGLFSQCILLIPIDENDLEICSEDILLPCRGYIAVPSKDSLHEKALHMIAGLPRTHFPVSIIMIDS